MAESRHAAARLGVVAFEVAEELYRFDRENYPLLVRDGIRRLYKCAITECAYFTDPSLRDRVRSIVDWLDGTWRDAMFEVHASLLDEATGKLPEGPEPLKGVVAHGARALGELSRVLAAWQKQEEVLDLPPLPSRNELKSATESAAREAGQT